MAKTEENNEVADPAHAEPHTEDVESGGPKTSDQQPISSEQDDEEPASPEQPDTKSANKETVNSEQAQTRPVSEEAVDSKQVETQPVNEEALDSEHAETQPLNEEASASEQPETQPISEEMVASEQPELEPVSEEPADKEQTEIEPVSTESPGPDQAGADPIHDDLVDSGPADGEAKHAEPVSSEMTNQQSADTDMENSQHDFSVLDAPHPVHAEPQPDTDNAASAEESQQVVTMEPTNAEETGVEHAESEHFDHQQPDSVLVHPDADNLEQMTEQGEQMSLDNHGEQPTELAYSHSDVQELDVSEQMSSEHMHSQPVGSEHVATHLVHTEFVNSHSFNHEHHHPEMYVETLHDKGEYVKMEHVHPEPMHTEGMNSDIEQQLQVSSELMHQLQVSSDLDHQLQVSPDLVHMQPLGSEIIHSQPMDHDLDHSEHPGSEFDHSPNVGSDMANMQLVVTDMGNSEPADPDTQPNKRRKKKSIVWEHFTIETVGEGCRRACCKVCKQSFAYSTGSKVAGTSHLKRHIAKGTCPMILRQQEKNQLTPYVPKSAGTETGTPPPTADPPKRRYRSSSAPYLIFDQDKCRHEIARMIIMHEYPLHMVEHSGFVSFVQSLQPRFDMVNFNTVQGDCVATYLREKQNLQKFIDGMPGRICLTVDMWTSNQTTGYVFLHGQFIDHEWKLHKRLLNIVMEPFPDSDTALSHAVATCLSYWNLDNKLCSITFNQPVGDTGRENMRGLLSVKNPSILNGQLLVGSCLARTLSGMAQSVLAAGQDAVAKIRSSVKYVKTSDAHEDKFLELKQQLQVPSEKTLTLDNVTRWNTSFDMLVAACELKEVFSCLDTSDPEYKDAPTMDDWKQAETICVYLKLLLETSNFLLAKMPPSTNIFFHEVWKIQLELTRHAASEDPFVCTIAGLLQEKFLKYWRDSFLILAIAVAMDPRFKMKLVEFSFTKLFGEEAPTYIRMVDEGIHELFHEYVALPLPLTPAYGEDAHQGNFKADGNQSGSLVSSNGLSDFDMYIMETTSQQMKSELDQYLDESLLPRVQEIDVLGWWKMNRIKYPTLSKMARDILSIPLSSVGPDYVFDTVGREMDQYRSSLRPETMEALMCAKDWLQYQHSEAANGHDVKLERGF